MKSSRRVHLWTRLESASVSTVRSRAYSVEVSGTGVEPGKRKVARANCGFALVTQKDSAGLWRIVVVSRPGGKAFNLDTRYGAGLTGLPFPDEVFPARPASKQSSGKP